jgi:hypothetical protein
LRDVLSDVTGLDTEDLRPRYVRLGDSGEVAYESSASRARRSESTGVHARRRRKPRRALERHARQRKTSVRFWSMRSLRATALEAK